MRRLLVIGSLLAGCVPPSSNYPAVHYIPVLPLAAYPPAPYPTPYPAGWYEARYAGAPAYPGYPSGYPAYAPQVAEVEFQTPSLAVRALAGKISASASNGDCASALAAGNELEKVDAESHHAILAVDERYAQCVRGF